MHHTVFVKLNTLRGIDVAFNFASHHDSVCCDVAGYFTRRANGHRNFVAWGCLDVAQHLAIDSDTVEQHQSAMDGGGAANQGVKTLLRRRE